MNVYVLVFAATQCCSPTIFLNNNQVIPLTGTITETTVITPGIVNLPGTTSGGSTIVDGISSLIHTEPAINLIKCSDKQEPRVEFTTKKEEAEKQLESGTAVFKISFSGLLPKIAKLSRQTTYKVIETEIVQ